MKPRASTLIVPTAVVLGLMLGWVVFSYLVVPSLIEWLLRGSAPAPLNRILSGRAVHTARDYLNYWSWINNAVLLVLSMTALIVLQMSRRVPAEPEPRVTSAAPAGTPDVGKTRMRLIYGFVFLIAAGSLFDIVTASEHWPFSPYGMYSVVKRNHTVTDLRLVGITNEGSPSEFALLESQYLQPFDRSRLGASLSTLLRRADRERVLESALQDLLSRYEKLRVAGRHDGPALKGLRLYEMFWKLDSRAANLDYPDRKLLLFEITQPQTGSSR